MDKGKRAEYNKKYRERNREKYIEAQRDYRERNKEKLALAAKLRWHDNKSKYIESKKAYRENNKEAIRARYMKKYDSLDLSVRDLHYGSNRSYYIDMETFMELWEKHKEKHGLRCAVTGESFIILDKHSRPSVDQISPGSGYWAWNIRFVTLAYNLARSNYGDARFESMCRAYVAKLDKTN